MILGIRKEIQKMYMMKIFQHNDDMMHIKNQITFVIQIGRRGHWFNNAVGNLQANNQNVDAVLVYEYENPPV